MPRLEIDQSGKIEQTHRLTVVGVANGSTLTIGITAREKQKLQRLFRQQNQRRLFVVLTFCALVALAIKETNINDQEIIIDCEYPGFDDFILRKIKDFLEILGVAKAQIRVGTIGKKSPAHIASIASFRIKRCKKMVTANTVWGLAQTKKPGSA